MDLEEWFPFHGACIFCGFSDARHRDFENIKGRVADGEDEMDVSEDYEVPIEVIQFILAATDKELYRSN